MRKKDFQGKWEIIETEMWEKEDLDMTETAFISFDGDSGNFHFLCVDGFMDVEYTKSGVEFSWLGNDEMDSVCGRGLAVIYKGKIEGKIYFHNGDNSSFVAKRI